MLLPRDTVRSLALVLLVVLSAPSPAAPQAGTVPSAPKITGFRAADVGPELERGTSGGTAACAAIASGAFRASAAAREGTARVVCASSGEGDGLKKRASSGIGVRGKIVPAR